MSFILDALKKLEREKKAGAPGVVVVGPAPWGHSERRRTTRTVFLTAAVLVAAVVAAALVGSFWQPREGPSPPPAGPTAPPGTTAAAPPPPRADQALAGPTVRPPAPHELELPGPPSPPSSLGAEPGAGEVAPAWSDDTPKGSAEGREFRLTAISMRDGEPIALLNDRLVREGDVFDGVRVLRIGTAEVEIELDGERRTIGF